LSFMIAMPAAEHDLEQELFSEDPPSTEQIIQYLFEVADGLQQMHAKDVIHRDIKVENILIVDDKGVGTPSGVSNLHAVVADLGSACALGEENGKNEGVQRCRPKTWGGTVNFLSPQVVVGGSHAGAFAKKDDVWALGVVAYILFAKDDLPFLPRLGSPAYRGSSETVTPWDQMRAILGGSTDGIANDLSVEPGLKIIINDMLNTDAEERPDAEEVAKALKILMAKHQWKVDTEFKADKTEESDGLLDISKVERYRSVDTFQFRLPPCACTAEEPDCQTLSGPPKHWLELAMYSMGAAVERAYPWSV